MEFASLVCQGASLAILITSVIHVRMAITSTKLNVCSAALLFARYARIILIAFNVLIDIILMDTHAFFVRPPALNA
jgi:hypothetical protein